MTKDQELFSQGFVLVREAEARKPLTREQYAELRAKLDALIAQADDPDGVGEVLSTVSLDPNLDQDFEYTS